MSDMANEIVMEYSSTLECVKKVKTYIRFIISDYVIYITYYGDWTRIFPINGTRQYDFRTQFHICPRLTTEMYLDLGKWVDKVVTVRSSSQIQGWEYFRFMHLSMLNPRERGSGMGWGF